MILALIGGGCLLLGLSYMIYVKYNNWNTEVPPIHIELPSFNGTNYNPHYKWIDLHHDTLRYHPNCFVALHPQHGIMFFDSDIQGFAEKYSESETNRSDLMVLHTSMLNQISMEA
jgi:hypothetical protein